MTWLNSGALDYHHDSVLEEAWLSYLVEHNFSDGQMGTVPDSGTLGHTTVTEGDFGHTVTRVLQATNLRTGGLQPKDCTKRLGHIRDWVGQQREPSPELDKDCSGIHNPRTAHWAPSPGLEKRLGRSFDWAHQRDADHPGTAGDADNPKTAQPIQLPLGLSISDLVHMGADPRVAQQDSQHPFWECCNI